MDMLGKVRRMRMRDSISISAIAKRTGLARNTIKKWLKAPGSVVPKYLRTKDLRKISSFEPVLLQALKADQLRHKDSRRTARALFVQITAQGYRGGYSGVTDFVRAWREQGGKAPKAPTSDRSRAESRLALKLVALPLPPPVFDEDGKRLPAGYPNFLILNGAVLVPTYGDAATDAEALRRLRPCFPGREALGLDCRALINQYGSLHCVTMQIPAAPGA